MAARDPVVGPAQGRPGTLGPCDRVVDRGAQDREVGHLPAQRGVGFAVDVQFEVGVAQDLGEPVEPVAFPGTAWRNAK